MLGEEYSVTLYSGPVPGPGQTTHESKVVACDSRSEPATDPTDRSIHPTDIVIALDRPNGQERDEPLWMLLRARAGLVGARILVIEDSPDSATYYREVLESAGAEAVIADDGATGLTRAAQGPYKLALVDVRLPDSNGYEISRLLSTIGSGWSAPILLMSADPTMLDVKRVREVGATGFVVNPVKPAELLATVASALSRTQPGIAYSNSELPTGARPDFLLRLAGRTSVATPTGWSELTSGRSADILATLAATCPRAVSSEQLSRLVWDETLTVSANALYTAISRLRRQLEGSHMAGAIVTEDDGYRLDIRPEHIDLVDFERRAQDELRDRDAATVDDLTALVETWSERPFPDGTNPLLTNWQNRLQELKSQVQELLTVKLALEGRSGDATNICRDLVLDEPWRESAWSLLIVCLYRSGRTRDALQAFRMARTQLRDDLGLDPGPGLSNLEGMILNHDEQLVNDLWLQSLTGALNRR